MNKCFVAVPVAALLFLSGCTAVTNFLTQPPPPPPVTPTIPDNVTNKVCNVIDTISWAVPVVEDIIDRGANLNDIEKTALDDAIQVINAGCEADNASWKQRAINAAKKLIDIVATFEPWKLHNARIYIPET